MYSRYRAVALLTGSAVAMIAAMHTPRAATILQEAPRPQQATVILPDSPPALALTPSAATDVTLDALSQPGIDQNPLPVIIPGQGNPELQATPQQTPAETQKADTTSPQPDAAPQPAINLAIRAALTRLAAEPEQPGEKISTEMRSRRQAVEAFYAGRNDAPLWLDKGQWTDAAKAAFSRLQRAAEDGLDLHGMKVYSLDKGSDAALAEGEIALSEAVAAYAFQASGGRVDPARISKLIAARPQIVDPAHALEATAQAADADATLQGFNPPQPGYLALRTKLAELRADPMPTARVASTDPSLRIAEAGRRTPIRADRLSGLEPAASKGEERARQQVEAEIVANMERWRWLPRDLGVDHLEVNIPDYEVRLYHGPALAYSTRVVVGKPDTPTPLFSNKMVYLIVNPSWNVPQSIIKKEMMPRLAADPNYLKRLGYDVDYENGRLHVRQPPGERNALGRIKFMFPNDYAVYLHDTPSRALFASTRRAFSHGCVRVDQPFDFAQAVLGPDKGWSEARMKKLIGGKERTVFLPESLPIHLVYFTVAVDESGNLRQSEDIYGYSRKVRSLLGLQG